MTDETAVLSQYVPAYRANLNLAPQQTDTRLLSAVDSELNYGVPGEFFNADDVGETDPEDVATRVADTPDKFIAEGRRVGMFSEFHDSAWFDNVDQTKVMVDPTSTKMQSLMAGRWRKVDSKILTAGLGNALIKADNTDTFTTQALPAAQVIPVNLQTTVHQDETIPGASADYGMSIGKLIEANFLLDESELEGPRFIALSSSQIRDLLQRTPATSKYYAEVQALQTGKVKGLLGFEFIQFAKKRLLLQAGSTVNRRCMAWIKPAIIYKGRTITNASIRIRHDKSDTPQAFYKAGHAAVRRYDAGVVEILCKEG